MANNHATILIQRYRYAVVTTNVDGSLLSCVLATYFCSLASETATKVCMKCEFITNLLVLDITKDVTHYITEEDLWRYPETELHDTKLDQLEYSEKTPNNEYYWIANIKNGQEYHLCILQSPSLIKQLKGAVNMFGPFRFEYIYSEDGTPRSKITPIAISPREWTD